MKQCSEFLHKFQKEEETCGLISVLPSLCVEFVLYVYTVHMQITLELLSQNRLGFSWMTKNILFLKCMLYICILSFQDWKCTNIESSDYSASSSSDQPHFQSQSKTFPQVMTNKNLPSNMVCECQTILESPDEGLEFQFKHNDFMSSTTVFWGGWAIKPSWVFCNYGDMKTSVV